MVSRYTVGIDTYYQCSQLANVYTYIYLNVIVHS